MIAKDKMPISTVGKEGFQTFLKCVAPLYKIPDRKKITSLIENKYEAISSIVKQELSKVSNVSITTDAWTDSLNNQSYLGVTCHYIMDFKQKSVNLGVTELSDHHTAENLKTWLLSIIKHWEIKEENIMAIVSDNAANITKAISEGFGADKHLPCLAHTLNLVPARIIESDAIIKPIIAKVKLVVAFFNRSYVAADKLRKVSTLTLIQSTDTRWNSTFDMLERFITLADKIASILLQLPNSPEMLTASELQTAKELAELLKPFKAATKIISANNMTGSKAIPVIKILKREFDSAEVSTDVGIHLKNALNAQFSHRFDKIEKMPLIPMATILDPTFKKMYFSDKLACVDAINKISMQLNDANAKVRKSQNSGQIESHSSNNESSASSKDFWNYHKQLLQESQSQLPDREGSEMSDEFRYYLSRPPVDANQDPLNFWKYHSCPELAKIAIRYMSVIATSVPSERLFSLAGLIMTDNRNRLTPAHLQHLLFLGSLKLEDWHL